MLIAGTGLGEVFSLWRLGSVWYKAALRTVMDAPVSTKSLTGTPAMLPCNDKSLGLSIISRSSFRMVHAGGGDGG